MEQTFDDLDESPTGKKCKGIAGILDAADELANEKGDPGVIDKEERRYEDQKRQRRCTQKTSQITQILLLVVNDALYPRSSAICPR